MTTTVTITIELQGAGIGSRRRIRSLAGLIAEELDGVGEVGHLRAVVGDVEVASFRIPEIEAST